MAPAGTVRAGHWLRMLLMTLIMMIPVWGICATLGHGWLSLLMLLPVLNIGLLQWAAVLAPRPPRLHPNASSELNAQRASTPAPPARHKPITVELQATVRPMVLTYYKLPPRCASRQVSIALTHCII